MTKALSALKIGELYCDSFPSPGYPEAFNFLKRSNKVHFSIQQGSILAIRPKPKSYMMKMSNHSTQYVMMVNCWESLPNTAGPRQTRVRPFKSPQS